MSYPKEYVLVSIEALTVPANENTERDLGRLGIAFVRAGTHTNLLNLTLPVGCQRLAGPNGLWLFPTVMKVPKDNTILTVYYEEGKRP